METEKYCMITPSDLFDAATCSSLVRPSNETKQQMAMFDSVEKCGSMVCYLRSPFQPSFSVGRTYFVEKDNKGK